MGPNHTDSQAPNIFYNNTCYLKNSFYLCIVKINQCLTAPKIKEQKMHYYVTSNQNAMCNGKC